MILCQATFIAIFDWYTMGWTHLEKIKLQMAYSSFPIITKSSASILYLLLSVSSQLNKWILWNMSHFHRPQRPKGPYSKQSWANVIESHPIRQLGILSGNKTNTVLVEHAWELGVDLGKRTHLWTRKDWILNTECAPRMSGREVGMPVFDDLADHTGGKSPLTVSGGRSVASS